MKKYITFIFVSILALNSEAKQIITSDTIALIQYYQEAEEYYYQTEQEYAAIQCAKQIHSLVSSYYGTDSELYIQSLLQLSKLYAERLYPRIANHYHSQVFIPYMEMLRSRFCALSESERINYWEHAATYFRQTMSIAFETAQPNRFDDTSPLAGDAYNAQLLSKGLLLNLFRDFENYIYRSKNQNAIRLWEQRKRMSANATTMQLDSMDYLILKGLQESGMPYHIDKLAYTWQDVQSHLKENDLAIEFFKTSQGYYGALLLKRGWNAPRIIQITMGERIKNNWETRKQTGKRYHYIPLDSIIQSSQSPKGIQPISDLWRIADLIFPNRLLQYFPKKGEGTVYFSADGMLHQTPLEYLPFVKKRNASNDNDYVAYNDYFDMQRLSSTRQIMMFNSSDTVSSAVLFGDIKHSSYPSLSQSKNEILNVEYLLNEYNVHTTHYLDCMATKENFLSIDSLDKQIIHVATHGFYNTIDTLNSSVLDRCGLVFTETNQNDSLLASEVVTMDLQDVQLVTLSACETALGDITGDGVFGLQRSFKMAGAQSILMSLWEVDDIPTRILMENFYWFLGQGKSMHAALNAAQDVVREQYEEPSQWAGFILLDGCK